MHTADELASVQRDGPSAQMRLSLGRRYFLYISSRLTRTDNIFLHRPSTILSPVHQLH